MTHAAQAEGGLGHHGDAVVGLVAVAQRAFDGIAEGHFLIPTHYHPRVYAQRRADEMAEAYDRLAEIDTADYDLNTIVAEYLSEAEQ